MTPPSTCLLYSANKDWTAGVIASLGTTAAVRPVDTSAHVLFELEQQPGLVLLIDLQTPQSCEVLNLVSRRHPQTVIIAIGIGGSDPLLYAEQAGVYAVEPEPLEPTRLAGLVRRALQLVEITAENRLLREQTHKLTVTAEVVQNQPKPDTDTTMDIRDFAAAMRHFTHVETLLQRLVDEVANALRVSRIGIFCRSRDIASYRLRAGLRCLESISTLEYDETHPYVLWLTRHSHAVGRDHLDHIRDVGARVMLTTVLDQLGAEVLIPLQSHHRLLGWLFVGHLANGLPFEKNHLNHLISLTECVSTTLENALLYEEATIQKTLAETLLHAMPSGIIAVDDGGIIRWYNDSARALFGVTPEMAIGRPIERLGSRIADLLRCTLGESGSARADEWEDTLTGRYMVVRTRRLANQTHCLGAVAMVQDLTEQRAMKARQDSLERATFWTELAASLSHEVRNPLVAIKTFAQLLPERYEEKEFQNEFKELVSSEIERLNSIVDMIHSFANPPTLSFKPFPLKRCLETCVTHLFPKDQPSTTKIALAIPESLPVIEGDERALGEAFTHILTNSKEALAGSPRGEITIAANQEISPQGPIIKITFRDNGPGVPASLAGKEFSPFSTTKARGMGLGLPIARRTVLDHHGTITLHSNEFGVLLTLTLPAKMAIGESGS